jgi:predicted RNase H-like nuclease (RuvC/YqgF family)
MCAQCALDAQRMRGEAMSEPGKHTDLDALIASVDDGLAEAAERLLAENERLVAEVERLRADVERLRAQNKASSDEWTKRTAKDQRELARLKGLMSQAWEHHQRHAEDPNVGYSQYGLAGAAVLVGRLTESEAEVEDLRRRLAETVPRSALEQVGWWHKGTVLHRYYHDGARSCVDGCQPVYVLRATP